MGKCDRLELERSTAVKQATKVTEESEMMRRTLESALREADTTAKNLREDLERVNRKFTAELNQSRQEVFRLKEQLSSTKSELEQSEEAREAANKQHWEEMTAQKKVTERVQLELASSRKSEERLNLEKQELLEKIRQPTVERQRLSTDLDSERKSHAETKVELGEALANAQAIHREKLESVSSIDHSWCRSAQQQIQSRTRRSCSESTCAEPPKTETQRARSWRTQCEGIWPLTRNLKKQTNSRRVSSIAWRRYHLPKRTCLVDQLSIRDSCRPELQHRCSLLGYTHQSLQTGTLVRLASPLQKTSTCN